MFLHLTLLGIYLYLPLTLVVNEDSSGKRKERVEERLELVDGEDREDEGHLTST